ncbi:Por secretion system C-terminal sorting domain-containing protein [Reichenbachiella faecimaris]|uniref:Por secretion system C-terminal sorting domain-containing protein n=1 Tax=Reichenbachiella faecimaris TaxID=692418 RepID=A0A1W2GN95_REIFA|nr:T9SS type A sorting domain-containing protein [Reichenbachiella faecimaris]SMD38133.1 Por secretion system C-terminal sorting domain-containing protein [Reichenbachiella faecimaris]
MKALSLLVIATLTFSTVSMAEIHGAATKEVSEVKANIFTQNNGMVYIQVENPADSKVRIAIKDNAGVLLHGETVKKTKMLKRFDISNLPAGTYSYEVNSADYSVMKKIEKK